MSKMIINILSKNITLVLIAILLSSCAAEWQSNTGGSNKLYYEQSLF